MTTFPRPEIHGADAERTIITVTVEGAKDQTIPTIELAVAALNSLEGWSGAQVEDAENGVYNVEVPAQLEASLRHEGWIETWALTPNGDRLFVSAEA